MVLTDMHQDFWRIDHDPSGTGIGHPAALFDLRLGRSPPRLPPSGLCPDLRADNPPRSRAGSRPCRRAPGGMTIVMRWVWSLGSVLIVAVAIGWFGSPGTGLVRRPVRFDDGAVRVAGRSGGRYVTTKGSRAVRLRGPRRVRLRLDHGPAAGPAFRAGSERTWSRPINVGPLTISSVAMSSRTSASGTQAIRSASVMSVGGPMYSAPSAR